MRIVDPHVHIWKSDPAYPWAAETTTPPAEDRTPEMLLALMAANGVEKTVLVQVIHYRWDNSYVADAVARYPDRFMGVGRVNPQDPAAPDRLSWWTEERGLHGLRLSPSGDASGDWFRGPLMPPLFGRAEELGVPMLILTQPSRLVDLVPLIESHPELDVVVDHMADVHPEDREGRRLLVGLARFPRLFVKVSHTWSLSKEGYPWKDTHGLVEEVYQAFGPHRITWGTDWPVCLARAEYPQTLAVVRREMGFIAAADLEWVLGKTALRLWSFGEPPPASKEKGPMNIGIVGAENSHTVAIARVLNVDKRIPGVRVTHVWGETAALARKAAEAGQIPTIVRRPQDLIGAVNAAAVDHRHGKFHLPAARPLLDAGMPLFIDKPFCYRLAEGRRFLARAAELKVPVCSFSTLPKQEAFRQLQREARKLGEIYAVVSTGPCDLKSKWGGVFFYGIHQVDMVLRVLGYKVQSVQVARGAGQNHVATIAFAGGAVATLNLIGGGSAPFHLSVIGAKGRLDQTVAFDQSPYLGGVREFVRMFKTGRTTENAATMLGPVAVLEALEKSITRKHPVKLSA